MKSNFKFIFFVVFVLILSNCAKTGSPDGGPIDEDAPIFITANPAFESTKFDKKDIRIYFNEYIILKDLNKQLVVSPPMKNRPLITPQGTSSKYINIKILDALSKNTTYIFNFGNSVEDNNEGNTLENFKYVMSTGNHIDSLVTSGKVRDAFLKDFQKDINVLLYRIDSSYTDSIIFKQKPNYVTNTLDSTLFNFTNLRKGRYFLMALKEASSDYLFNPKTDKIGFSLDTIYLPKDSVIVKSLAIFNEELPYVFKRGKEVSKGKIQFGYAGKEENLKVKLLSKVPKNFKSITKFEKDRDTLNYWYANAEMDSLQFVISSGKKLDTTTVFLRKKKIDSLAMSSLTGRTLHVRDTFFVGSNTPIVKIDTSKISLFDKDTLGVKFSSFVSKKENKIGILFDKEQSQNYKLDVLPGAFLDVFEVENDSLTFSFGTEKLEYYGKITLSIVGDTSQNLVFDLIDEEDRQIQTKVLKKGARQIVFDYLVPQKYIVRAIVDTNNNNKWDTGNFLKKQQPEKIIYYKEVLEIRENSFVENDFKIE